jgi:hypothetical protein
MYCKTTYAYKILEINPQIKRTTRKHEQSWQDNNKMNLIEVLRLPVCCRCMADGASPHL